MVKKDPQAYFLTCDFWSRWDAVNSCVHVEQFWFITQTYLESVSQPGIKVQKPRFIPYPDIYTDDLVLFHTQKSTWEDLFSFLVHLLVLYACPEYNKSVTARCAIHFVLPTINENFNTMSGTHFVPGLNEINFVFVKDFARLGI